MTNTRRFSALGTTIEGGICAATVESDQLWAEIGQRVADFERRFSRFRPDSELSKMNMQAGRPTPVSAELLQLLQAAESAYALTEGIVDPTIGQALIAAGYDVSFESIENDDAATPGDMTVVRTALKYVDIDPATHTVTLPARTTIDFGGIGKGYLLDQIRPLVEQLTKDYWLSFGGDLLVSGVNEQGQRWETGVQDPLNHDRDIARLQPPAGTYGLATSGTTKRRGVHHGQPWHHLIDPRTGRPAETDVIAATVLAPTALQADVFAKTVLILGSVDGVEWLRKMPHTDAAVVTSTGQLVTTPGMNDLLVVA